MGATFELYQEKTSQQWRWSLRHGNGKIIADSGEAYTTKDNAVNGINSVKQNAPTAPIKELTTAR